MKRSDRAAEAAEYASQGLAVFPAQPNGKRPLHNGWKDEATTDPKEAKSMFLELPRANIAIATGAPSELLVLDVDVKNGKRGEESLAELELKTGKLRNTAMVCTASGGLHLYFRHDGDPIKNSVGKLGDGLDIRATNGLVIAPSSKIDGKRYVWTRDLDRIRDVPDSLIELLAVQGSSREKLKRKGFGKAGRIPEGQRNDFLFRTACGLRARALPPDVILESMRVINQKQCAVPLDDTELQALVASAVVYPAGSYGVNAASETNSVLPAAVNAPEVLNLPDMLKRFVQVAKGPRIIDLSNMRRAYKPEEFQAAYAHCEERNGDNKPVPFTRRWERHAHRLVADDRTFDPSESQFFTQSGLRMLNSWVPPSWPVVAVVLAAIFFKHLDYLIPDRSAREDFLDWLAHAVQRPGIRPHRHFLLVSPKQGTGRSWLVELFIKLFSHRHAGRTELHALLNDSFNSELSGRVIMGVDEVKSPPDARFSQREKMNSLFTNGTIRVNEKNQPRWDEKFVTRFLMMTNRDDALPLSETDRRVYVVRGATKPKKAPYYVRLYDKLNDPKFLAAVWTALSQRDLSQFNPGARAPLNEMKRQMIEAGRSADQQIAVDLVTACPHDVVAAVDLMTALVPVYDQEPPRDRRVRINSVTAVLKELGLQTLAKKMRIGDTVTRVWVLRNSGRWVDAKESDISAEARAAEADFEQVNHDAQKLLKLWEEAEE